MKKDEIQKSIYTVFGDNPYPGDPFLQGSFEGDEPYEEVGAFKGKTNWREIEAAFLDLHYTALSFFSEAGFRFYLPAYLIADLNDQVDTADPVFHLTHGFNDQTYEIDINGKKFIVEPDKSTYINPRRYGAMTTYDHARQRMSIFTREEAQVIVAYLQYKLEQTDIPLNIPRIQAALDTFWLERAHSAPTAADLKKYMDSQNPRLNNLQE
jgi:hypothetical protein